jgi:Flp pilus assembly pilin Flp
MADAKQCEGRMRERLARDQRGAVSLEYLTVTAIGLTVAAALGVLGVAMVDAFGQSLEVLYSEYP